MWSCVHGHVSIELLRIAYATPEIAWYPASDLEALVDAQIAAAEVAAAR